LAEVARKRVIMFELKHTQAETWRIGNIDAIVKEE
jgi:post-segregation antitoxin (ccd killing protein)